MVFYYSYYKWIILAILLISFQIQCKHNTEKIINKKILIKNTKPLSKKK